MAPVAGSGGSALQILQTQNALLLLKMLQIFSGLMMWCVLKPNKMFPLRLICLQARFKKFGQPMWEEIEKPRIPVNFMKREVQSWWGSAWAELGKPRHPCNCLDPLQHPSWHTARILLHHLSMQRTEPRCFQLCVPRV